MRDVTKRIFVAALLMMGTTITFSQGTTNSADPSLVPAAPSQTAAPVRLEMPKSYNPLHAYTPDRVPDPVLANSPRIDRLVRDGKLYLTLRDAIDLALENNLDLAIARYNLPIANTDILRTQAGGVFRGVNTGVVQGTQGGGVGGYRCRALREPGAGGTTSGAGGAGAGASGLVQSTLGTGTQFLPTIPQSSEPSEMSIKQRRLSNLQIYGVPTLQLNTGQFNLITSQSFPTGTTISFGFDNNRQATNSPFTNLSPELEFAISPFVFAGTACRIWSRSQPALFADCQE